MSRENYAVIERPGNGSGGPVLILMILGPAPTTSAAGGVSGSAAKRPRDSLTILLEAIHNGGANADEALRKGVNDSDANVRVLALQTLGERGGNSGADALRQASQAEQPATRLAALEVMAERGDLDPMPAFTEALHDPDVEVKGYAMQLLLQKAGPRAIPVLRRALNSDSDPGFRTFIGEALSNYNASHAPDTEIPGN
jgi:HEAT repeat protein